MAGHLKTAEEKKQLIFTYLAFMLNGMLALSIGSLLPFIRESKGLNYAFAGMIVSLHSVGNLASSFASGTLSVFLGRKKRVISDSLKSRCFIYVPLPSFFICVQSRELSAG